MSSDLVYYTNCSLLYRLKLAGLLLGQIMPLLTDNFGKHMIILQKNTTAQIPFSTGANHLAGTENQSSRTRVAYSHNNCSKSFWIVLGISCVQSNLLQVQFASQVNSAYNISAQ